MMVKTLMTDPGPISSSLKPLTTALSERIGEEGDTAGPSEFICE